MLEIFGYISSVVVLISFLMKDMLKLRIINTIACVMFAIYGFLHGAIPIVAVNVMIILVNVFYLIKMRMEKKFYNESIFNGKMTPLTGFEAEVLNETLRKSSKSEPTLPGRK